MKFEWLKQGENNSAVIVIFSGWGFAADVYAHLLAKDDDYDVVFVNDYRDLSLKLPDLRQYQQRYLLAWSFGVAAFAAWYNQQKSTVRFDRMIAINGTMQAVDRFQGIPEVVMQKTIDTLSEQSFQVFAKRCFVKEALPDSLVINISERAEELQVILQRKHAEINGWDFVWIASQDKIFPTKNQQRAWQVYNDNAVKLAAVRVCDAPHAPFHLWSNWDEIVCSN